MLIPDQAVLQTAVEHYLALAAEENPTVDASTRNAAYTQCVLTGTRTVSETRSAVNTLRPGSPTPETRPHTSMLPSAESGSGQTEVIS
ncbi:DUF5133 domain-containing protein [Streptomyces sp. NPDC096013]|uniref:DUF5133 domain-containing protein n=1 Tax=Streptomyces sp. NPDC096013 TaxID=3366069 RepID=UPI0037F33E15